MNRLPVEILLKIEEFRKEVFMDRVRCFEDEHGYALRYSYIKNINIHMRVYWQYCLKSIRAVGPAHSDGLLDYNYSPGNPDYYDDSEEDEIGSEDSFSEKSDVSTDSYSFRYIDE